MHNLLEHNRKAYHFIRLQVARSYKLVLALSKLLRLTRYWLDDILSLNRCAKPH